MKNHIQIEYLPHTALKPHPKNPRTHSVRQVKQIARSIEQFGFVSPILLDDEGFIIAGHGRLLAAQQLGMDDVPVVHLAHLTKAQAKALMLADNKLTENAGWDQALLAECFIELGEMSFDLEITGFEMAEIDLTIQGFQAAESDSADEMPDIPSHTPVTRAGDLWLLGRHRILCGNSLDPMAMQRLMQSDRAQMIFTDPPYNVPVDGHVGGLGDIRHREFAMASGEMTAEQFTSFLTTACENMAAHSTDGSLHYICMDWRHLREMLAAGHQAYTELKNICVWVKDNGGMGSLYRSRHELVLVFKHGIGKHRNNVELGAHGRYRTNVWEYAGVNSFSRNHDDEGNLLTLHPTVKPVTMIADAIMDCTKRGELVLDTFLGSGSTLIAAEKSGRICYGMELDPLYVDTAIRRWQNLTGQQAVRAGDSKTFDALVDKMEMAHV